MSDKGRVALVTGGVQGLGAAMAKALKESGFKVAVGHLGAEERARAFGEETGLPIYEWDISDFDACVKGVELIVKDLGRLTYL